MGGSDEVLRMKERAKEVHDFVHVLTNLLRKLELQPQQQDGIGKEESKEAILVIFLSLFQNISRNIPKHTIDIPKTAASII